MYVLILHVLLFSGIYTSLNKDEVEFNHPGCVHVKFDSAVEICIYHLARAIRHSYVYLAWFTFWWLLEKYHYSLIKTFDLPHVTITPPNTVVSCNDNSNHSCLGQTKVTTREKVTLILVINCSYNIQTDKCSNQNTRIP